MIKRRAARTFPPIVLLLVGVVAGCTHGSVVVDTTTHTATQTQTAVHSTSAAPAYKPEPARTVDPLPPQAAPATGEKEQACPYIASMPTDDPNVSAGAIDGSRIYRTTVLTDLKPVGCRFYFWAPSFYAIVDIVEHSVNHEAAHNAMVLTAQAGKDAISANPTSSRASMPCCIERSSTVPMATRTGHAPSPRKQDGRHRPNRNIIQRVGVSEGGCTQDPVLRQDGSARYRSRGSPVSTDIATQLATLHTNFGDIRILLFGNHAPGKSIRNFTGLSDRLPKEWTHPADGRGQAKVHLHGVIFHRVISGFMIQGGDPLGKGYGGPGYKFGDEFHQELWLRSSLPAGDG